MYDRKPHNGILKADHHNLTQKHVAGIEIGKFKLVAQTRFLIKKNVYI
jgi:hypothetical protein